MTVATAYRSPAQPRSSHRRLNPPLVVLISLSVVATV